MEYAEYRADVLALCNFAEQAEQRNVELVEALRGVLGWLEKGGVRSAHVALANAIARAESATPAKHPDTVIVDYLESHHRTVMAFADGSFSCWTLDGYECRGNTVREVVAAAMGKAAHD